MIHGKDPGTPQLLQLRQRKVLSGRIPMYFSPQSYLASLRLCSCRKRGAVVGVDIALSELSSFLEDIPIGERGSGPILRTTEAYLVAHPELAERLALRDELEMLRTDELASIPNAPELELSELGQDTKEL